MAADDLITTLPLTLDRGKMAEERSRLYEKKIEELRVSRKELHENMENLYKNRSGASNLSSDESEDDPDDEIQDDDSGNDDTSKEKSLLEKDNELLEKAIQDIDGDETTEAEEETHDIPETLAREVDDLDNEITARAHIYQRENELRDNYEREMFLIKQENDLLKRNYEEEKKRALSYETKMEEEWLEKLKKGLNDALTVGDQEAWNTIMLAINDINNKNHLKRLEEKFVERVNETPSWQQQNTLQQPQWNSWQNQTANQPQAPSLPGYGTSNPWSYAPNASGRQNQQEAVVNSKKVVKGLPTKSTVSSSGAVKGSGRISGLTSDIKLSDEATNLLNQRVIYKKDSKGTKIPLSLEDKKKLHVELNRNLINKKGK